MKQLSVIVPVYNHASFVDGCLRAIDSQAPDLQIIVIDDGSKDQSWAHIERFEFSSRHEVVRLRSPNRGAHAALNAGLRLATGQWIALCNSDDEFSTQRLERLLHWAHLTQRRFLFSTVECIDADGRTVAAGTPYTDDLLRTQTAIPDFPSTGWALMPTNVTISTGNFFFERTLLEEVGYFRPYRLVHDWDFALRALLVCEPFWVPEALYKYRIHGANSFSSLMGAVAARECPELMRRYWKAAVRTRPRNPLAPSPHNWPIYSDVFLAEHRYQPYLTEWDHIDEPYYAA